MKLNEFQRKFVIARGYSEAMTRDVMSSIVHVSVLIKGEQVDVEDVECTLDGDLLIITKE